LIENSTVKKNDWMIWGGVDLAVWANVDNTKLSNKVAGHLARAFSAYLEETVFSKSDSKLWSEAGTGSAWLLTTK